MGNQPVQGQKDLEVRAAGFFQSLEQVAGQYLQDWRVPAPCAGSFFHKMLKILFLFSRPGKEQSIFRVLLVLLP